MESIKVIKDNIIIYTGVLFVKRLTWIPAHTMF